jgi:subtilisin family serine protease
VRASSDRIVVRPVRGLSAVELADLHRTHGGRVLEALPLSGIQVVAVRGDPAAAVRSYASDPRVDLAELNVLHQLARIPSDSLYPAQDHLAHIRCPEAWDTSTGSPEVVVAVIDSGIDLDHPDLAANLWSNPGEIPGNGEDDDANGYVDDVVGWDFVGSDPIVDPEPDGEDDDGSGEIDENVVHGTAVAGCIAAVGDNGTGIAGVAWNIRLMPLRIFGDDGFADTGHIAEAILYATRNGADIINMSLGGGYHAVADDAIREAFDSEVLIVAAGGNGAIDLDETPQSPVSNDLGQNMILGVAAVTADDRLAAFSAFGEDHIDLSAPGVSILTTSFHDGTLAYRDLYRSRSGTSFSAPLVSGVAALTKAAHPELEGAALRDRLIRAVDPVDSINPDFAGRMGSGRTNARLAVGDELDRRPSQPSGPTPVPGATDVGAEVTLTWEPSTDPRGEAVRYDLYFGDTEPPPLRETLTGPRAEVGGLSEGRDYRWRVVARNESGYSHSGPLWGFTPGAADIHEPDNVPAQARPIEVDGSLQRHRLASGDTDYARFPAEAGTRYEIRTRATIPGSGAGAADKGAALRADSSTDTVIALLDPEGRVLAENDDVDPGRDLASRILWTCTASGEYLVRVRGYDAASSGPYSLSARVAPGDSGEPPAPPTEPSPPDLSIGHPERLDLSWRSAGDASAARYDVVVRDGAGEVVRSATDLAESRLTLGDLTNGETYAWRVEARDGAGRSTAGPTWRFSVGLGDPYEPDDHPDTAGTIAPGPAQIRAFSSAADVDRVRFSVRAGQAYRLYSDGRGETPAEVHMRLLGQDGTELASGTGEVTLAPDADGIVEAVLGAADGPGMYALSLDGPQVSVAEIRVEAAPASVEYGQPLRLAGEMLDAAGLRVPMAPYQATIRAPDGVALTDPISDATDALGRIDLNTSQLGSRLGVLEALIEAGGTSGEAAFTVAFRRDVPPPEGESRLRILTAPVGGAPETVFGLGLLDPSSALAAYLPSQETYRIHTGVEVAIEPGKGYFVRHRDVLTMKATAGVLPDPGRPFVVPLSAGWNLIGNPFLEGVVWSLDRFGVRRGGSRIATLGEAAAMGLVEPYAWAWDTRDNEYRFVFDASLGGVTKGTLEPFEGAWVFAAEDDLALEIPPPQAPGQASTTSRIVERSTGALCLRIADDGGAEERSLIAFFDGETAVRGLTPPQPPGAGSSLRAAFSGDGRRGALAHLRQGGAVVIELETDSEHRRVTLTWPDLRGLSRQVRPILTDRATGRAVQLRTAASLTLDLRAGESRSLVLEWPREREWLRISITSVDGTARGSTARVRLSRSADVSARIVNQAGRIVRSWDLGSQPAGGLEVHWNGRDDRGSSLPAGIYALELHATTADGERASARARLVR